MITLSVKEVKGGYYNRQDILRGVNFELLKGELLCVIGPNGSGKSTLIKALTGILPYENGEINYFGEKLKNYSPIELAKIVAVVPTPSVPLFAFTARETIEMGRYCKKRESTSKEDREIVEKAAFNTDVLHLLERKIDNLSAGELQRVIIARALAQQTKIILLDEPTAHLDISHQMKIFQLLKDLAKDGVSILCVSHDLNLAAEFSSRVLLFSVGQVYSDGLPGEVITQKNLASVYGTLVRVQDNPYSGQPIVLPSIMEEYNDKE